MDKQEASWPSWLLAQSLWLTATTLTWDPLDLEGKDSLIVINIVRMAFLEKDSPEFWACELDLDLVMEEEEELMVRTVDLEEEEEMQGLELIVLLLRLYVPLLVMAQLLEGLQLDKPICVRVSSWVELEDPVEETKMEFVEAEEAMEEEPSLCMHGT